MAHQQGAYTSLLGAAGGGRAEPTRWRAGVLWHTASGLVFSGQMVIDTVLVDTEAMTLALVWRSHLAGQMQAERAEAVFQTRPEAELFNLRSQQPQPAIEAAHG